jgi:hypothetical protein
MASGDTGPAAALAEILKLLRIGSLKRRREAEEDTGEYGDEESEKEDAGTDVNLAETGDIGGCEG